MLANTTAHTLMRSGLKQKPILSNIDYYEMLPRRVREVIAHSPYDVKNCDWIYAIYTKCGIRAAIAEVETDQRVQVGMRAYNDYGIKHPQAVKPNLMSLRRNA